MPRPTNEQLAERAELERAGLRRCRACDAVLPLDDFGFHQGKRRDRCKPCTNAQARGYVQVLREQDPELYRARRKAWNAKHRASLTPEQRAAVNRKHSLRQHYGIGPEWVDAKLEEQGGGCAVCGNGTTTGRNWHVDHDHQTGALRGVLCATCNVGLGAFHDDPEVLRSAAAYVERYRA